MLSHVALGVAAGSVALAQPALRGTNASRSLSDSVVTCQDSGEWANINWCGGGGDWSCTPWAFTVDWTSDCESHNGCWTTIECDGGDGSLIVGNDNGAGIYLPKWQRADGSWCDSVTCADESSGGANYFVFHTCDGAGLQSDCKGSQWYVEQLSQYNGERGTNGGDPQVGEVHPSGTTNPSFNFYHPGTANEYEWYWCGWWSKVEAWAGFDASVGWMDNTNGGSEVSNSGSGHTPSWARDAFGGQDADATVALYPWICQNGADADKTGIQNGAAMYAGDHGGKIWNCFCDNNGPNGHPGDSQPPPHYKLYSLKKEGDKWLHVVGVAGDAIDPGVSNEDFYLEAGDGW